MKPYSKINSGITLVALFVFLAFSGCNSPTTSDQKTNTAKADTLKKGITLSPETQILLSKFPTPFEVTMMLEKAKAGFIIDLTNPPANANKYTTEISKALALGVYSADLSYSATYNRTDETGKFLVCTNKLADELGISGVYDQSMLDKVKKYNNNKDSLVVLINNVFNQTKEFLAKNNRNRIAAIIAAGGFSEGLYLAASLGEVSRDNTKIMAIIANQKENHMKLFTILEEYSSDENIKPVSEGIARLKPIWNIYDIESGKKIPQPKAVEISKLTESVRSVFVK